MSSSLVLVLALTMIAGVADAQAVQAQVRPRVLVVYFSRTGHTQSMAEAIAKGAREGGAQVTIRSVAVATTQDVLAADAIVIGTPVHNANPTPEILSFINSWPLAGAPLKDRLGAVFVTAGGTSAGEEAVLLSLQRSLLVFGMIIVGGDDWRSAFGASAITGEWPEKEQPVAPHFLSRGEGLGRRVASVALRWLGLDEKHAAENRRNDTEAEQ